MSSKDVVTKKVLINNFSISITQIPKEIILKKITYFFFFILLLASCSKEKQTTDSPEPIQYKEFDTAPVPKTPIAPFVAFSHPGGETILQFNVNIRGKTDNVIILNSSGNDVLDQAAISAVENTPFIPAMLSGSPVAVTTELEIIFPENNDESIPAKAITRDDLNDVYQEQVSTTLQQLGVKISDRQKLDFSINFESQISESNIEINALHLEEEISFMKNEIKNFVYHMNNEDGSLESGMQLYRSISELRITLVDIDGNVLAESHLEENDITTMDNHGSRPEILDAKVGEYGIATRYSETLNKKFLYVAYGYEEDDDNRRIYIRFSKAMSDIHEQRVLRVYEQELIKALDASDVNLNVSQKEDFINSFLKNLKTKLSEKNIDSNLEKNERVAKAYTIKLEEKTQEIADQLKLEIGTFIEYLRKAGSDLQITSETYGWSSNMRITLIDKEGNVLADSDMSQESVQNMENHGSRPEVAQANRLPYGIISRFSNTLNQKFVYLAHRLSEPINKIQYVRLARSIRADYSKIRISNDKVINLYLSLIEKSLIRSGISFDTIQKNNFEKSYKSMVSKRNSELKMDPKLERYRLYIEEINRAFDAIRLEMEDSKSDSFFDIYKESVVREFSASKNLDVLKNEEIVRTYYKNILAKKKNKSKTIVKDGPIITYHENGRIKLKGQYKSGKKDAIWKKFNQKGKLISIITYDLGNITKTENPGAIQDSVIYHDNGRIKMQGLTNTGKRDGEWKHFDSKGKLLTITMYDFGEVISQKNPGAIENITEYHENGRLKAEGITKNRKKDGLWKIYNSRGNHIKNITYSNGEVLKTVSMIKSSGPKLREGSSVTYHDNGRIKETGKYSKGKKHGEWKEFDSRGKLLKTIIYNKGKVINEQKRHKIKPFLSYHNNGRIKEKGMLKNGRREGEWLLYNARGKLVRTTNYLDGDIVDKTSTGLVGPITNYYENGFIKEEGIVNSGQRDGVWKIYDESGRHIQNITYRNGKVIKKDKV